MVFLFLLLLALYALPTNLIVQLTCNNINLSTVCVIMVCIQFSSLARYMT